MKLTLLLLLAIFFQAKAHITSAQNISLEIKKTEIKEILSTIETESSYRFIYSPNLAALHAKVDISVQNKSVEAILAQLLKNSGLEFQFLSKELITIVAKAGTEYSKPVTGTVIGLNNEPLQGVSIIEKGTKNGTTTKADGTFSLTVTGSNSVLVISYVGYQSIEHKILAEGPINITLEASAKETEEIVVVGYGTARKKDLTGSVASINGAELAKQPVLTATQAVQGKVAGVQVISSGDPNALPVVRIRGTGTMLAGVNPLYVVDGVINDDIRNINSADILSMEVLKDASATAIYGMRAANGVIIISTKRGKAGKMVINMDATFGLKEATKLVNMAGANQYAGYINEASVYYGSGDSVVTQAQLNAGGNTDWYDEILKKGFFQNHNISLSGGAEKINYFLSAGYLTDEGIIRTNNFNRFTVRSNNDYKISNILKLSTLIAYSKSNARAVDLGAFNIAYRAAPYMHGKVGDKYGNTSLSNNVANPLVSQDYRNSTAAGDRFQGNLVAELKPLRWLTLKSSFGVDKNNLRKIAYNYKFANTGTENIFITSGGNQLRNNSQLTVDEIQGNRWVWDNTAAISQKFGSHSFSVLLGTTAEQIKSNTLTGSRLDVPEDKNQWYLAAASATGATNNNTGDKSTRNSYLGRLNYNFLDKYLLTATGRYDGSSRLPGQNRWGFFPSVGAGWVISREDFMKNIGAINNLKLRMSYGKVGNDGIPSNLFIPLATINLPYFFSGTENSGIRLSELSDPYLGWEITTETNLGLDFSLLKNKLSGTVDWYNRKTTDALVRVKVASILGDPDDEYITNAASFTNKGVEFGLNWKDAINRDWSYNIGGNIAFNTNAISKLNGGQAIREGAVGQQGNTTLSDSGQAIGSFYLWQVASIFQSEDEIKQSAQPNAVPGDLRYVDNNKDGVINADDRVFMGSYQPKFIFGINGGISYKSIDFSIAGYGTAGGKIYNGKKAARGDTRDNIETAVANGRWTPNNKNTNIPRANMNELPASSFFLEKGDFFRINNLTLGYTTPAGVLSKIKAQNIRAYVSIQNLATFTKYTGFTPEINPVEPGATGAVANRGTLAGGIESAIYPSVRTFTIGIHLGF